MNAALHSTHLIVTRTSGHMLAMWGLAGVTAIAVISQRHSRMVVDVWLAFTAGLSQPQQATEPTLSSAGLSQGGAPSGVAGAPPAPSILPSWLQMGVRLRRDDR